VADSSATVKADWNIFLGGKLHWRRFENLLQGVLFASTASACYLDLQYASCRASCILLRILRCHIASLPACAARARKCGVGRACVLGASSAGVDLALSKKGMRPRPAHVARSKCPTPSDFFMSKLKINTTKYLKNLLRRHVLTRLLLLCYLDVGYASCCAFCILLRIPQKKARIPSCTACSKICDLGT